KWVLFIGIIGMGFLAPRIMLTRSTMAAHACYWAYAAMWGLLISPMIYIFLTQMPNGPADIARAFFITAGMFAGMSIFGYTTKRDLSPMGRVLMMVTIGLLLAVVVNIFIGSMGFQLLLSFGVVIVFALLTAFETQQIKEMYYSASDGDEVTRMAIFGAFMLYGSFVTMFIWILQILAILRGE
ncbi:MAG: Bax inhibitor-1/YccA family protein, partial [Pseudomonadota bacterium]